MAKFFVVFTGSEAEPFLVSSGMAPGSALRAKNMERVVSAFENLVANGCAEGPHCSGDMRLIAGDALVGPGRQCDSV